MTKASEIAGYPNTLPGIIAQVLAGYGIGADTPVLQETDFNDMGAVPTGLYAVFGTYDSGPDGTASYAGLLKISRSSEPDPTCYMELNISGSVYSREGTDSGSGFSWTPWRQHWTNDTKASQEDAEEGLDNDKGMTPLRTHQAFGQFGLGVSTVYSDDLDDLTASGFYYADDSATNTPDGIEGHVIAVQHPNGDDTCQLFITLDADTVYFRRRKEEVWSDWVSLMTPDGTVQIMDLFGRAATVKNLEEQADLDTVLTSGEYNVYDAANKPTGASDWIYLVVRAHSESDDYVYQEAVARDTTTYVRKWARIRDNGVWGDWCEFPTVYAGSTKDETDFPVGHTLITYSTNGSENRADRNASDTIQLGDGNDGSPADGGYRNGGTGTALSGTWRARGATGDLDDGKYLQLWQRVA